MGLNKFITVCVLHAIIRVYSVLSVPAFGSEFVHIKVYLPNEPSTTEQIIKSKHPHIHHKIIKHYRPLQRPIKNLPVKQSAPVLGKYFPAELDKPYIHDYLYQHEHGPKYIEETFLVKEQLYNSKPIGNKYEHRHQHVADTKQLIDYQHHEDHDHHVATLKFVDDEPQYNNQQEKHKEYDYHIPKEEVIKVIEAPRYTKTSVQDYDSYRHEPQVKEVVEEEHKYNDNHQQDKNYKYESHYETQYGYQQPKKPQEELYLYQNAPRIKYHYSQEANISIQDHTYSIEHKDGIHKYSQQEQPNFNKHTSTYFEPYTTNYKTNVGNSNNNEPKNVKNEKYLFSSEVSLNLNEFQRQNQKHNFTENNSNTTDDLSKAVENPHAIETYTGYDSYSAAHVQGLGSGGYRHHM